MMTARDLIVSPSWNFALEALNPSVMVYGDIWNVLEVIEIKEVARIGPNPID